ncbi:MAG: radical SAM protein [Candidatus Omnitrophica bacterium]|nr:radical SAM protein [Candidatus Omnitrophota bacterium]
MTSYRIDNHKLIFHPGRVSEWLKNKDTSPIYIEISPSSVCNHRCIFCAFDYLGHKPVFLNADILKKFIRDIAQHKAKSILFSGEGEPLLVRRLPEVICFAKKKGLDVALTTNGLFLTKETTGRILPYLTWLRISFNAGTPRTYSFVHKTSAGDFRKIINNLREAVRLKKDKNYACTIGVQFLLLKENYKEALTLANIMKSLGVDYLIVKPYSQHPLSTNRLKSSLDYKEFLYLENRLKKIENKHFKIIFRNRTMAKISEKRPYKRCLGHPFYAHLTAEGDLYACSSFLGDRRFCYGNIYRDSFDKI